jgi:hypothetical protein
MEAHMETRKVSEIVWREDLYPRFEPSPATIQQYAESIDELPPIEINQRNELIDGYHRWTAHKKAGCETISVTVTQTASDREFLLLAIRRNATHGLQLNMEEKKKFARELYTVKDGEKEELIKLLSVSKRTIYDWLSRKDKDLKEERNRKIAELWLACYTEEEIAEQVDLSVFPVHQLLEKPYEIANLQKNKILSEYNEPDWTPPIYNVWKRQEKTNGVSHFGNSELSFVDNLLYLYTQPFDIVVDPFAGGGTTVDLCKKRLRRYWVSDRLPIIERRDIRTWDILQGPPPLHKRWKDVSLLYLDPPYWKQAEGQYSKDSEDLANMSLDDFYGHLFDFITNTAAKMKSGARIALMIQPTQWKNENKVVTDHVADFLALMGEHLNLEMRISCPYESQQNTAQMVQWAKENRRLLVLTREIIVWSVK